MKTKLLLIALLLVVFSGQAFCQDVTIIQSNSDVDNSQSYSSSSSTQKKPRFWIGPKFGTDLVGIPKDGDAVSDILKDTWQAGLMLQFGRTLYLQPEVYYSVSNYNNTALRSTAIKIPALLGLRFLNLGLFSLHISGGPCWTLPLENDNSGLTGTNTMDWVLGAGVDILGFITTDIRYKITEDSPADQINNFNIDTTPLNVTVGLKFR